MKKIVMSFLAAFLVLSGCSAGTDTNDGKLSVVVTIFAAYDWADEIIGDTDADITMLLDDGVDMHSYQPTAQDIVKISECDVFIYVGGESDAWVEDALSNAVNEDMQAVNLMEALGDAVKEEEIIEGMQEEEESEEETEYDEHVWLSLKNAEVLCGSIADALQAADPDNAETYTENLSDYLLQLDEMDEAYQAAVDQASVSTILFGDRFPFRYLTDDYGLTYYAAFPGCSAESEASFETITYLANKIDELGLKSILTIEGSDQSIAETIRDNTASKDQSVLTLNSMQSVTSDDISSGITYLSVMEENLEVLKTALQ